MRTFGPTVSFSVLLALGAALLAPPPAGATAFPAITVFESSFVLESGTPLADALDALGLDYVYRTSTPPFDVDLASGQYDIALVNSSSVDITGLADALENFLDGGGHVLMFLYNIDGASAAGLWQQMGAAFESNFLVPPASLEIVAPDHPVFNTPNSIGQITLSRDSDTDNGDYLSLLSRGSALARSPGGDADHLLMVLRRDGRSILNSFLPGDFIDDADMVNLIENQITYMVEGIAAEDFDANPPPFDLLFSPTRCTSCLDGDHDPGPGLCYCDNLCLEIGDCCYDACTLCGRCLP